MTGDREEILAERVLFRGKVFRVLGRDIRLPGGDVVTWEVVDKGADSVAVVALAPGFVVHLVREYFGGTGVRALSLPKGRIDDGETAVQAAAREMSEEIGMTGRLELLSTMEVSPGYLAQRTHVYLATDLVPDRRAGDETHYLRPVRVPLTEAVAMCADGRITEARTIAGLLLTANRLRAA
ncbi:NUDIX domain-containing protein [Actinophytocola sp. KF-1]